MGIKQLVESDSSQGQRAGPGLCEPSGWCYRRHSGFTKSQPAEDALKTYIGTQEIYVGQHFEPGEKWITLLATPLQEFQRLFAITQSLIDYAPP